MSNKGLFLSRTFTKNHPSRFSRKMMAKNFLPGEAEISVTQPKKLMDEEGIFDQYSVLPEIDNEGWESFPYCTKP